MNELQVFKNEEYGEIRTINKDGEPWFVAKDVCEVLEIKNTTDAIKRLDIDEVTRFNLGGLSGETNIVNEYGLYSLILGSRKPEAKQFKRWITHDVVPSIRKHGMYAKDELLANPDLFISALEELKREREGRIQAENLVQYKTEVINGMVDDIDILTKRNVLNRVVKHKGADYRQRWSELYQVFREKYSIDLKARCEGYNKKQTKKKDELTVVKYAEKFGHMDNLYKVAVKLYESDINSILDELRTEGH